MSNGLNQLVLRVWSRKEIVWAWRPLSGGFIKLHNVSKGLNDLILQSMPRPIQKCSNVMSRLQAYCFHISAGEKLHLFSSSSHVVHEVLAAYPMSLSVTEYVEK